MKKIVMALAAGCCAGAFGAATTVGAGETLVVTDATVANYADGLEFADATGTVEFNTSSAPTMNITGNGTVKKTSSATWVLSKDLSAFGGTYDLTAGTTIFCPTSTSGNNFLGKVDSGAIYVRAGADLHLLADLSGTPKDGNYPLNVRLQNKPLHIAGSGPAGMGALVTTNKFQITNWGFMHNLILDDDATWGFSNGPYFYSGSIALGGHALTFKGRGDVYLSHGGKLSGEGDVILTSDAAGGKPSLNFRTYTMTSSTTSGFRLRGGSMSLTDSDNTPDKRDRPIWVEENAGLSYVDYWSTPDLTWEKRVGWMGPINIAAGKTLTLTAAHDKRLFSVEGEISGAGTISTSWGSLPTLCVKGNDSFTGSFRIGHNGQYTLMSPFTANAYAFTSEDGVWEALRLQVYPDQVLWDWTNAVKFANATKWTDDKFPLFGGVTNIYKGATLPSIELDPAVTLTKLIGSETPVSFTPSTTRDKLVNFRWHAGEATITGGRDKTVNLGEFSTSTRQGSPGSAVVRVSDVTVMTTETNSYEIGCAYTKIGRLTISNAVWSVKDPTNRTNYGAVAVGSFRLGASGGTGELRIEKDAVVTNLFTIGDSNAGSMDGGWQGTGAVIQNGGEVYALGTSTSHKTSALGPGTGLGYYELNGGVFTAQKMFDVGGYSLGNFVVNGGTATWGSTLMIGACNGGTGHFRAKGGTTTVNGSITLRSTYQGDASFGIFSAEGSNTYVKANSVYANGNKDTVNSNNLLPCPLSYAVVRDGATFEAASGGFGCRYGTFDVGFDGGTYKVCSVDVFQNGNPAPARPTVYPGGLTIHSDAPNAYTYQPIKGATGKGVKSIALPTLPELYVAPIIHITGDGCGAVAACEFDSANHVVTGVKILSPGRDYTCVTALVYYAVNSEVGNTGSTAAKAVPNVLLTSTAGEVVLEDNVNTGSFTKTGTGNFHLRATNTWGGATIVAGGCLYAHNDQAIPDNRALTLSGGGVMDLGGQAIRIASVTYGVGGGSIVNASAATVPTAFGIALSVDDMLADRAVTFTGDVDLSSATVTLTGEIPTNLDPETRSRYNLATTTGRFTGTPAYVSATLPPNWRFSVRSRSVSLVHATGFSIILR